MKPKTPRSGFIILIIVFTAVCLFTFASILLVSAKQTQTQSNLIKDRQKDYYAACNHAQEAIAEYLNQNGTYEKTFIINDEETLCISFTVTDRNYTITRWQIQNIAEWNPDTHMNLIQ